MSATLPYSSSYSMRATTPPLLFQRGQSTTTTTATAAPYQPQQQQQQHVAPSLGTVLLAPSSQYPPHNNSGYPPTTVAQSAPSSRPTSPSLLSHHNYPPQAAGAGRHTASMVPMSDAAAPPPTVPMALPPSSTTAYHQLVLPRSRPSTPTAPPQRNGSVAAPQPHPQQHYSGGAASYYAAEQDPQSMTTVHSAGTGWAPQYPSYPQQQQQQHAHLSSVVPTTVQASIDHYQAKVQQEQQQLQRLEFQEQAMLTEEQQLRATLAELERQRAQVGDEMALLNDQWARLWDQEEWLQVTPFVDLSAEIGAVEHNCNTLRHVLDDRQQELQGLEIELKRYEGNAALQERLLGSLQKVEQCAEKMESHRRTLQLRAEKLFEAETHRDRATQRHLADVTEAIRRCEGTLNIVGSTGTVAPSSSSLSRGPSVSNNNYSSSVPPLRSREGSVAADHGITTVPRTRMVSFGPSPVVPRRVGGAASSSSMMFGTAVEGGDSILLDTTSHDSYSSSYGGLAGESIAISLCGTKKPRRESLAA